MKIFTKNLDSINIMVKILLHKNKKRQKIIFKNNSWNFRVQVDFICYCHQIVNFIEEWDFFFFQIQDEYTVQAQCLQNKSQKVQTFSVKIFQAFILLNLCTDLQDPTIVVNSHNCWELNSFFFLKKKKTSSL